MHDKSQVASIFLHFEPMIGQKISYKIKCLQSDSGSELYKLESYLFQQGYTHMISCSYTSSQNGVVECKNHHVVENDLSMLIISGVPLA